jgi:hypothetical protein
VSGAKKPDVKQLVDAAHRQGTLSARSLAALDIPDLGAQIQAGLGVAVDDVTSTEVVLVTMMPDDSGSIAHAGNEAAVRDGHNAVLDALARSRQAGDVLVHTRYLNGEVLTPYTTVRNAPRMTPANYHAIHGTPLYDQTVVLLGTVLVKAQELADAGVPARTVTLLITDGADCSSQRAGAADVAALVADLLGAENHIVAGLGIADGSTDFRAVFRSMGIPDRWILTPASSASEIRRAFQVFSQSAVAASQGGSFSKTALGGFTN